MKPFATALCGLLALVLLAVPAEAQLCDTIEEVTIREINAIPQGNINQLIELGAAATIADIRANLTNEFDNPRRPEGAPFRCVRVEAVVLSDPRYSGLAAINPENIPNRIHFFIRDVAAETEGVEGMTIQVVDETQSGFALSLRPGDIVEMEGYLNIFSTAGGNVQRTWQLAPIDGESFDVLGSADLEAAWLQPVALSSADINTVVAVDAGEPLVQANWANFSNLHGQYVRIEGGQITNSEQAARPNWAVATIGEDARVGSYDVSLRFRNDRVCPGTNCYPNPPFFTRDPEDPFLVPPPGAIVNVQGFLTFGVFDAFNIGLPPRAYLYLSPIRDEDFEVSESPPIINLPVLTFVPDGPIPVTATVVSGSGAPITAVTLHYEFSGGAEGEIGMTFAGGDQFEATIPTTAEQDGEFVSFWVTSEDALGLQNESAIRRTRLLAGGISSIAHIQETATGGQGPSPFAGLTTSMDLNVVVMTEVSVSGIITVQDGTEPWSGVHVFRTGELEALLERGMTLNITTAEIEETFGMTRLRIPSGGFTVTGTTDPYPYVILSTADVATGNDAEKYEGMALRFENVVITSENPDAPSNFGEWAFSSDGTAANQLRGDDASPQIPFGSDMFEVGDELDFIQGVLAFTFSNWKLWPETLEDIGFEVSSEGGATAQGIRLDALYPNPLVRQGTLGYQLAQDGHVTLELFDVTGRRVAVLVNGHQPAGMQEVNVDASGLASGVYIVRLVAGDQVQTTRFVVAR